MPQGWTKAKETSAPPSSGNQLTGHIRRLVVATFLLQHIGKKEQLQYKEDHKQLDEDHGPQDLPQRHAPESFHIEADYLTQDIVIRHGSSGL